MSTCKDVRDVALGLDGVEEVDHWGRPAFRTRRRIFITLRPDEQKAMFHLPEEHRDLLFEMRPEAFEPLHWGKATACLVSLDKVPSAELAALVREACAYAGGATKRTKPRPARKAAKIRSPGRRSRPRN